MGTPQVRGMYMDANSRIRDNSGHTFSMCLALFKVSPSKLYKRGWGITDLLTEVPRFYVTCLSLLSY